MSCLDLYKKLALGESIEATAANNASNLSRPN